MRTILSSRLETALPPGAGRLCLLMTLLTGVAGTVGAQQPDSARAADSLALVRELEKALQDSGVVARVPRVTARQAVNPRLLPDISLVGDLIFDVSPDGTTQEDGSRLGVREIEAQFTAAVDPYFRGDILLSYSDAEGVAVEQATMTATALPWGLEAQLGRFFLPFGKQNTMHRESLHTIDYPWALKRFLGEEALKGTGVLVSKVLAPFGFYQELIATVHDQFGEADEELLPDEPANRRLDGLGYSLRLRNYWDLTTHANVELSASAATGKLPQPVVGLGEGGAVNARRTVLGADFTYRWRPLQQGLYKSFLLQGEILHEINDATPTLPAGLLPAAYQGPDRNHTGGYLLARYQLTRRTFLGVRGDLLQDPELDGGTLRAGSLYWQFYPSEFSKLLAGVERLAPEHGDHSTRLILQAVFAIGPHRPHPF